MRRLLPHDVKAALIEVCGRAFWYKQPLFDMFDRAGIPEDLYIKYESEAKFTIARKVIADLERMDEEGLLLQRRLVAEMFKLRDLPDSNVPDRDVGLETLWTLKLAVQQHDLVVCEEKASGVERTVAAERVVQRARDRNLRLQELKRTFVVLATSSDRQKRGYELEELLYELFTIYEIQYRRSYTADGEQVDGFFAFGGFDYILEARWRQRAPDLGELAAIRTKVDRKIKSTRGFVVSIAPYRENILRRLREAGPANLILMDGEDLALILEGQVSLVDALQAKVDKAAQEGIVFFPLKNLFS